MKQATENYYQFLCDTFSGAADLIESNQDLVDLTPFSVKSNEEIESQAFNLALTIPTRLKEDEEIAMWLLENEQLNRKSVAKLFGEFCENQIVQSTLEKIALKVCSLEAASGFVEGLKIFLPIVGCWEPSMEENEIDEDLLENVLQTYAKSHIARSPTPLFHTSTDCSSILKEIANHTLTLYQTLHRGKTAQAMAMSIFFNSIRNTLRKGDGLTLSIKGMTDLFIATSTGRPFACLQMPEDIPSYLFTKIMCSGMVQMSFQMSDQLTRFYARLTDNALYLFDVNENSDPRAIYFHDKLVFCVPLSFVMIRRGDLQYHDDVVELYNFSGKQLPVIDYRNQLGNESNLLPTSILYCDQVVLNLSSGSDFTNLDEEDEEVFINKEIDLIDHWIDSIEQAAWGCRSKMNKPK